VKTAEKEAIQQLQQKVQQAKQLAAKEIEAIRQV
jgi:hypothetical protein